MNHPQCPLAHVLQLTSLSSLLFIAANLTSSLGFAQNCGQSDNVSFSFTSPPKIDILERDSARWSVDAGIRFAFQGDWCPIPEDITFEDDEGTPIPAVIYFRTQTSLVDNGPRPPQIALVKPLMSLGVSTDYTLTLSPPNPALAMYSDYTLSFRTARAPLNVDYESFEGVKTVEVDGNLCEGEGLFISDSENFDCIVPSFLQLKVGFNALPNHEVSYLVYRVSSTPTDPDAGLDLIDDVERSLAFLPGVSEERAQRSVEVSFPVLYAPFPREECFKVVTLDEWGRERSGHDQVVCANLGKPSECSEAQFPEPNPFENTPPIEESPCETIGINGASPGTPIPQLMDEPVDEEMEAEEEMEESSSGDEGGCDQKASSQGPLILLSIISILILSMRRERRFGLV